MEWWQACIWCVEVLPVWTGHGPGTFSNKFPLHRRWDTARTRNKFGEVTLILRLRYCFVVISGMACRCKARIKSTNEVYEIHSNIIKLVMLAENLVELEFQTEMVTTLKLVFVRGSWREPHQYQIFILGRKPNWWQKLAKTPSQSNPNPCLLWLTGSSFSCRNGHRTVWCLTLK